MALSAAEKHRLDDQIERAAKYEVARLVALMLRRLGQPPATIAATTAEPLNLITSILGEKLAELRAELDVADDELMPELNTEPRETQAPA